LKTATQLKFGSLCGVAMVMVLGNSMLIPVLPSIKRALGITQVQVGLIITAFSISAGLTIPIAGFISDRVGRTPVIVAALVLYGLAGVAAGLAGALFDRPLIPILGIRAVQGIGAGGTFQIAMALTGDMFKSQERRAALGYLEASNGTGKVLAPLAGASLGMLAWTAPFYLYGVAALPVAAAVWRAIEEPSNPGEKKTVAQYWQSLLGVFGAKLVSLAVCFLAGMLVLFLYFGVLSNLSDVLEREQHLTGILLGLVIAVPVSAMAITSFFGGRWLAGRPARALRLVAGVGMGLAAAGLVAAFLVARNAVLLVGAIVIMGVGNGMVLPSLNTLITSSASIDERGLVTSLYGTVRHLGAASGPPLFGMVVEAGGNLVYAGAAVLAAVVAAMLFFLVEEKRMLADKGEPQPRLEHS